MGGPVVVARMRTTSRPPPLAPIDNSANARIARHVVERIRNCKAIPGSLEWRTFCETEVRLTLDAAAATYRPVSSPEVLDVDKIPAAERGRLFGG
jgi:hypothetical protein